jgi:hypothetical protein
MKATVEVFWNARPEVPSETAFLKQLQADLKSAGISATILANYFTNSGSRQVDFLLVTEQHVCHVELKSYTGIIRGTKNGPWSIVKPAGTVEVLADRQNPYTQALGCKMAISDDMHQLASRDDTIPQPPQGKFYTQLDSVVCVFPRLEDGSEVPNDYRVKTLGYADFVQFITTPGKHPDWTRDHWSALIRSLALVSAGEPRPKALPKNAAQELVSGYGRWFSDFYRRDLHELVPLPLELSATKISPGDFANRLQEAKHGQLVGPSGCGKSHLIKHMLLNLSGTSVIPILVEGTLYQGRLSTLLNRSVARFINGSANDLLRAAAINGQTVLLVIDGYNECPKGLQDRLLGDLASFVRRTKAMTLITSQSSVTLPGTLSGISANAGDLTDTDREAVLDSYGAPEIAHLCEPFTTAYELSLAAECAGELKSRLTRAGLFAAFIRRRLSETTSPTLTRDALRQLALIMDEGLTTSLPIDEAWRTTERHLAELSAPLIVADDVFRSSLTATGQGRLSFTHELLGRFLATEALLQQHRELPDLVQSLCRPRHEDLTDFAVELESDADRLAQLLSGLADWHLYAQALRGHFGTPAARVSVAAARRLLHDVTEAMDSVTFTIQPEYELLVAGGYELSAADRALLTAVGALVREGGSLNDVVALLDATDTACRRSADAQAKAERRRPTPSASVAAVLVGLGRTARSTVAASIILAAMQGGTHLDSRFRSYPSKPTVTTRDLLPLIETATAKDHGRLMLLCSLLQAMDGLEAASLGLRLLRLCWDSGAYHVVLEGLTMIQSFAAATRDNPLHEQIADFLESLNTSNITLSTQLIETLYSYDRIESPYDEGGVRESIDALLANPLSEESGQLAYGIVSNQFEDFIGEPYYTAIASLSTEERVQLYSMASIGAPPYGFWNDWLLSELVKAGDPKALPAFKHWATCLNPDTIFQQGWTACYLLAIQGCALFLEEPPEVDAQTNDQAAWQCYGAILFWMHRPQFDSREIRTRCAPYWQRLSNELLPAAADPLCQFMWASDTYVHRGGPAVGQLLRMFPDEARQILEWGLKHRESLSSIFRPHVSERISDIIHILGSVGNAETIELLRSYTDDRSLGRVAISAIKQLTP